MKSQEKQKIQDKNLMNVRVTKVSTKLNEDVKTLRSLIHAKTGVYYRMDDLYREILSIGYNSLKTNPESIIQTP